MKEKEKGEASNSLNPSVLLSTMLSSPPSRHAAAMPRTVLDYIEDTGLQEISNYWKELEELRVFPSDPYAQEPNVSLIEQGAL